MLEDSEIRARFLEDNIEILEPLAQGGMADVYKAKQIILQRLVAVKVLRLEHESDLLRFQNEARALGTLDHACIVKNLSFGILQGSQIPYMVMEYIDGVTLATELEKGPFSLKRFRDLFMPLLSALSYAHEKGLIHRDIKPSNIMLKYGAEEEIEFVKLLDFGIARLLLDENSDKQSLTRTGMLLGSPAFMSPEQCRGQKVDNKTDVYSLCCVMFEALYGRPLFSAGSALELMSMHLNSAPPTVAELLREPDSSEQLAQLILSGLAKQPAARPSAHELAEKLKVILDSTTLSKVIGLRKPVARKFSPTVILLFFAVVIICSLVVLKQRMDQQRLSRDASINMKDSDLAPSTLLSRGRAMQQKGDYVEAIAIYQSALDSLRKKKHYEELTFAVNAQLAECCMKLYRRDERSRHWLGKAHAYSDQAWTYALEHLIGPDDSEQARNRVKDACRLQCTLCALDENSHSKIPAMVARAVSKLNKTDSLDVEIDSYRKLLECGQIEPAETLAKSIRKLKSEFGEDSYPYVKASAEELLLLEKNHEIRKLVESADLIGRKLIMSSHKSFAADRRLSVLANTILLALAEAHQPDEIEKLILLNNEINPGDEFAGRYQYSICYLRLGASYIELKDWTKAIPALKTSWKILSGLTTDAANIDAKRSCLDQLERACIALGLRGEHEKFRKLRQELE